jgi:hypothetical protein
MPVVAADRGEVASEAASRPRAPGILLGIGLGGFVDGIVLHQILQWHHLLSSEGDYPKTTVGGLPSASGFCGDGRLTGGGQSAVARSSGGCSSAGAFSTS